MAKKKRTIIEEELPNDPLVEQDFVEVTQDAMPSNIDAVIDALESQVEKVTIYRRLAGQKQSYVVCLPIDEFADDGGVEGYVARYYGGGRYLARLQETNGKFIKGYTFSIDESVKPQPKTAGGNDVTQQANGDRAFERELLLALVAKGQGGGEGLAEQMKAMAAMAASNATAMMTAMGPLLAKISELASGNGKGGSMADLVAAIQLGADMGGDKENSYIPVIREVGVPLVKALETYMAKLRVNPPKPTSIVRAVGVAPGTGGVEEVRRLHEATAETTAPQLPPWAQMVAPFIGRVVDFAVHGGDPNVVAGIIYNTNPPLSRMLEDAVEHDGFEAELLQRFPQLQPHAEWVRSLLDEFREEEEHGDPTHEEVIEDSE